MRLYKVLDRDGKPFHGGNGVWPLPQNGPGEWLEVEGDLIPCHNGLHLCRESDLLEWLGPCIYEAEYDGEMIECENKAVVRRARLIRGTAWSDRTARLFACDCAERVLHLADDPRCATAIEVARRFANDEANEAELAAARDAVWAAARVAVRAAAWGAAREWQQQKLVELLDNHSND